MVINKPQPVMRRINYLSDFTLMVSPVDVAGVPLDFAQTNFALKFSVSGSKYTYTAQHRNGQFINCSLMDDGRIEVQFNHHPFSPGILKCELTVNYASELYEDGYKSVTIPIYPNIALTEGESDIIDQIIVDARLSILRGEKGADGKVGRDGVDGKDGKDGKAFTFSDLTPEQKAELKGEPGRDGRDGINGKDGRDGRDGQPGAKGEPFTFSDFTEAQLASIKGADGRDGKDGRDGADGAKGDKGEDLTRPEVINHTSDEAMLAIKPNEFHVWPDVTQLAISFIAPENPNENSEYMFEFSTGSVTPNVMFPASIKWVAEPTITVNKRYQVSVVRNVGIIIGVDK